jgi:hypothetical protein
MTAPMKRNLWIETEDNTRLVRCDDVMEYWIADWKGNRPDPKATPSTGKEWYIYVTMGHGGKIRLTERALGQRSARDSVEFLVNQVLETDITGIVRGWIRNNTPST